MLLDQHHWGPRSNAWADHGRAAACTGCRLLSIRFGSDQYLANPNFVHFQSGDWCFNTRGEYDHDTARCKPGSTGPCGRFRGTCSDFTEFIIDRCIRIILGL